MGTDTLQAAMGPGAHPGNRTRNPAVKRTFLSQVGLGPGVSPHELCADSRPCSFAKVTELCWLFGAVLHLTENARLKQGHQGKVGLKIRHGTEERMASSHLCQGGKDKYCKGKENFWKRYLMNVVTIRKLNWDGGREGGWGEGGVRVPSPRLQSR